MFWFSRLRPDAKTLPVGLLLCWGGVPVFYLLAGCELKGLRFQGRLSLQQ